MIVYNFEKHDFISYISSFILLLRFKTNVL